MSTTTLSSPESIRLTASKRKRKDWLLLALIGDDDLEPAVAFWRLHAAPAYRGLLDNDGWEFDEATQRYISDSGTKLRDDDQKRLAILFGIALELEIEKTTQAMTAGDMSVVEWQDATADLLKCGYTALGALGVGGVGRLTEEDRLIITGEPGSEIEWGIEEKPDIYEPRIGLGLADAYIRLARFGQQIEEGDSTAINPTHRAGEYGAAGQAVYEEARRSGHGRATDENGDPVFLFERNVLDDASLHCHATEYTEGCPELTDLGWMPIGSLPPPGLRTCRGGCNCRLQYSETGDDIAPAD